MFTNYTILQNPNKWKVFKPFFVDTSKMSKLNLYFTQKEDKEDKGINQLIRFESKDLNTIYNYNYSMYIISFCLGYLTHYYIKNK
jgi:hypothetical protein